MGKNRDRLSIIAAILEVSNSGASKTRIMFGANLSFKLLEKYLAVVKEAGFVHVKGSLYQLTEQGREFLKRYRLFHDKYSRVQESLESLGDEHDKLERLCVKSCLVYPSNSFLDGE